MAVCAYVYVCLSVCVDHDVSTLGHFREILSVVTKQIVSRKYFDRKETKRSEIVRTTVPSVYHLQPCHTMNISMAFVRTPKRSGKKHSNRSKNTKQKEGMKGRKLEVNNIRNSKEENLRSGRRPSPEDKVDVCWYGQSYDMFS